MHAKANPTANTRPKPYAKNKIIFSLQTPKNTHKSTYSSIEVDRIDGLPRYDASSEMRGETHAHKIQA
jgi:flagellar basal body rod protein FlgC